MTEEVYAENEQVRCKASRSEKRAEGEISFGSLSGRMMLHVEELFEFREFRDSCGFEVGQFSCQTWVGLVVGSGTGCNELGGLQKDEFTRGLDILLFHNSCPPIF
jgi:hypothetical protein